MAHEGNRDFTHLGSALVLRTSGSVELVDGDATAARDGRSGLYLRHTLVHLTQVLNYLASGESIERLEWTLLVNVRDASRAMLGDFHARFQSVFSGGSEPHASLERHLQLRAIVQPGDEQQVRITVQRADEYLSFVYGYREPRGHAANGWLVER